MTSEHGHGEQKFIWKYVFSVDHKTIGIQYAVTSLLFLLLGFTLVMIMRWQLAYPGRAIPLFTRVILIFLSDLAMTTRAPLPVCLEVPRSAPHS